MILITFRQTSGLGLGIKTPQGILDVAAANDDLKIPGVAETPDAFYSRGLSALPELAALMEQALADPRCAKWLLQEEVITFGPLVPHPEKIICIGLNYRRHAQESNMDLPSVPVLFSKYQNSLAGAGEPVPLPGVAEKYDYEAELAVVIGKRARYVPEDQALNYVLGYCNANDLSARDLQNRTSQWLLGKALDKFLPVGPYLLTADEAGDPQNWPVRSWLNGELRQNSNTGDMVFSVAQLVSFISQYMTLEPGDLISTGTPEGVILGKPRPRTWMKPGDMITVEVGPLGRLTSPLAPEVAPGTIGA
mgnify:CR=1 FL=1